MLVAVVPVTPTWQVCSYELNENEVEWRQRVCLYEIRGKVVALCYKCVKHGFLMATPSVPTPHASWAVMDLCRGVWELIITGLGTLVNSA